MQSVKLVFWILLCQLPGWAGAAAVSGGLAWYHGLAQPSFAPPDWLFGAAWSILYALLGVSGFLLTRGGLNRTIRPALFLFAIQLIINALWTPIFFGLRAPGWGLFVITIMIALAVRQMTLLWKICRPAFWPWVPYIFWLAFAWSLNYAVLLLN